MVWNKERLLLGEVGAHGEWGETQLVGDVDGCPALHGHVEHLDVVEHHQDVSHRAAVDVLHVGVTSLGEDQSVALLLLSKGRYSSISFLLENDVKLS